jgi:hypothetical protein
MARMELNQPSDADLPQQAIDAARARQELQMRWILLYTIVMAVLLSTAATLLYGPPKLPWAIVQSSWATLLAWLVKRLFRD